MLPWAMGPLNLLESIAEVPDGKSLKRANRLSSDFFLSPQDAHTRSVLQVYPGSSTLELVGKSSLLLSYYW